jgi:hypothetical protein
MTVNFWTEPCNKDAKNGLLRKASISYCVAQCLDLTDVGKLSKCNYEAQTGLVYETQQVNNIYEQPNTELSQLFGHALIALNENQNKTCPECWLPDFNDSKVIAKVYYSDLTLEHANLCGCQ